MLREPIASDPSRPLISVFIYNYNAKYLGQCLDSIFEQTLLDNLEIVYVDDVVTESSWKIVLEYAKKFPGIITMDRNKISVGPHRNLENCFVMAKGKYYVPLSFENAFVPEYIKKCIEAMESDPFVEYAMVRRKLGHSIHPPNIRQEPLVSIYIYNYNYGRYLRECFDSVFAQTYQNIEICFSDNASSDESWDIAVEYAEKYPGKMHITKNRINFGTDANVKNCVMHNSGKYHVLLCSDDALMPNFVEKCVRALEAYPNAGFAMVHRMIIDENNRSTDEAPFYNQSCVIPGAEQAAVYMLAAVNPSVSQIMYNTAMTYGKAAYGGLAARWYGTRIMDFNMCCEFDIVYFNEPLLRHRIHSKNDSFGSASNLMEVIGPYVLQHQFVEIGYSYHLSKVVDRLQESIEKVSKLCLRYCLRSLIQHDAKTALRYFHLSIAFMPEITENLLFKRMNQYWEADPSEKEEIIESLQGTENLTTRCVSYDPPQGSIPLEK